MVEHVSSLHKALNSIPSTAIIIIVNNNDDYACEKIKVSYKYILLHSICV